MNNTIMQTATPEAQTDEAQVLEQAYSAAAQCIVAGQSDAQIEGVLAERGFNQEIAETIISDLRSQFKEVRREAARKDMLHGALWCGGGLLVTGATYALASEGGSYIMTWGAVIGGVYQFLKGVFCAVKYR